MNELKSIKNIKEKYDLNIINEFELNLAMIKHLASYKYNSDIFVFSRYLLSTFNDLILTTINKYTSFSLLGNNGIYDHLLTINRMFMDSDITTTPNVNYDGFTCRYINKSYHTKTKYLILNQYCNLISSIEIYLQIPYKDDKTILIDCNGITYNTIIIPKKTLFVKKTFDHLFPFDPFLTTCLQWRDEIVPDDIIVIVNGIFINREKIEPVRNKFNSSTHCG
jgi:hypothetical protein